MPYIPMQTSNPPVSNIDTVVCKWLPQTPTVVFSPVITTATVASTIWVIAGLDSAGPINTNASNSRSDTLILVFDHGGTSTLNLLFVPRDSLVEITKPNIGIVGTSKITHSTVHGGINTLLQTITHNFGIIPNHYIVVNFTAVIKAIDAIGGVTINVEQRFCYKRVGDGQQRCIDAGLQHMDGEDFLGYWRIRNYGITHTSDITRVKRQIEILANTNIKQQIKQHLGPSLITTLGDVWLHNTRSDESLIQLLQTLNNWIDRPMTIDVLPGTFKTGQYVYDLTVPVSVYIWDKKWLKQYLLDK